MIARFVLSLIAMIALLASPEAGAAPRGPRVLKFSGVPQSLGLQIKKRYPFVFEREVTLAEVDEVVRFIMKSGGFSNVDVVEREAADGSGRELVLLASVQRRIRNVSVKGNTVLSTSEVQKILEVAVGQVFERKHLLASAEELRRTYENRGYHNAKVEIEFDVPNESEVGIIAVVTEGAPVRISDVIIESSNPSLVSSLGRMSRRMKNRIFTEEELLDFQKSVGDYLLKGRYLTARLSQPSIAFNPNRTQAKLTYLIENPWQFDFTIDGAQYFSVGQITEQIQSEKLAGAASPAPDMAERIRRMYQAIGFANVEVTHKETLKDRQQKLEIAFKIDEGSRVRIRKIEVTGSISRPESYYTQFIKSSSSDLIGSGYYNRKDIEEGAKRLVIELQNQGFLRAKVQSQRAEYSKDRATVTIHLAIDEGPLTQIRQIRVDGVESFPKSQVLEMLKIKTGAALGLKELEESIQQLKSFYRSEGFLEMKILNENEQSRIVTYNDTNTQATVSFQVFEGPRVIVGSIDVQGNSFTKEIVILREIPFKTGDTLTPEKIDEAIFRLQKLGLFSRVELRTLEEGTSIAERTVIISIDEAYPGVFTTGFGVNNDRRLTVRGYASIAYKNIRGTGRAVSLRVDPRYSTDPRISYLENTITVSYLEPYILGDRNRGRVNVVRDQRFHNYTTDDASAVILEENAIGFLLERDLTRNVKLTFTAYGFSNQRQFDRRNNNTLKIQNIAKVGPLFEFDFRDDVFTPTSGSYSFTNFEYSDPLLGSSEDNTQSIKFAKVNASYSQYNRVLNRRNLVWANSVRGGYLTNLSTAPQGGVPRQEAFFLGGRSSIRGFNPSNDIDQIPSRYDIGVSRFESGDPTEFKVTTDSSYYLLKTELRFPIYGNLGGAVFYDAGGVLLSQRPLDDTYRDAVGFGLRYATPVGPVNLEIAYKLDRRLLRAGDATKADVREEPYAFYFSIGAF